MPTFYFDMKDGVTVRDRHGADFASYEDAVAHSKVMAAQIRQDQTHMESDFRISVVNEAGAEVHCEMVNDDHAEGVAGSKHQR